MSLDLETSDDLPIALCKGKRKCGHPISFFVSYNHLSSSTCSFIASSDSVSIPKIVHEAVRPPIIHTYVRKGKKGNSPTSNERE